MKHAVIMLCHTDMSTVERHVRHFDDDFRFYIHIDKGSKIANAELERLAADNPNVRIYRKYRVRWGGIGIVKAELYLLRKVMDDGGADFIHICSGQDLPICSLDEIKEFFGQNKGHQFIECHRLPYSGWHGGSMWRLDRYHPFDILDCDSKTGKTIQRLLWRIQDSIHLRRKLPTQYAALYGGSNWMSLSGDCARYIAGGDERIRGFLKRLRHTFASDEVFFQTVVMNSPFADSVVPDSKRLTVWKPGSRSPEILTDADLWRIKTSDCLWARKFKSPESDTLLRILAERENVETEKDILLFVVHFLTDSLLERFMRVAEGFRSFGDAFIVYCGEISEQEKEICARLGAKLITIGEDHVNSLCYSPIEETIIPGSNHFLLMWVFSRLPYYRNYWNVEYDVDFSGEWETFFKTHSPRQADFISCRVKTIAEMPEWYWWYSFKPLTDEIPRENFMNSFNPIYRISRRALQALDRYLKEGNEGHHEVLIPTFLNHAGFKVSDFGGNGSFVDDGFKDSAYVTSGQYSSMRYRPAVDPNREMTEKDKLYHPVKE